MQGEVFSTLTERHKNAPPRLIAVFASNGYPLRILLRLFGCLLEASMRVSFR